jgi:hypothetical protein
MPVISATQEAEIGIIVVQGQPEQDSEASISPDKMGVVVHDCNPNYVDDVGRRIDV